MNRAMTLPARIEEYFPENQTATVKICAERVYNNIEGYEQLGEWLHIPDVPVLTISCNGFAFTMPIKKGDTCMICFSQVGYDHWFVNDLDTAGKLFGMPQPHLRRSFSEDDGFCFVGFNTLPRVFGDVSPDDSEWRNTQKTTKVILKANGDIEITTDSTIDINAQTVNMTAPDINIIGNITHTGDTIQTGNVTHIGNVTQTGDVDRTGNLTQTGDTVQSGNITYSGNLVDSGG